MAAAYILVVDDEPYILELVKEILLDEGYRVSTTENTRKARLSVAERKPDLALVDVWMPDEDGISLLKSWQETNELSFPVVMMSGHGTIETAVEATRLGAFDFVEKPISLSKLLMVVEKTLERSSQPTCTHTPDNQTDIKYLVGRSQYITALNEQIEKLARVDTNVFISGEVGSGKAMVAELIHQNSARSQQPFVRLVCNALDKHIAAAQIFGNEHLGTVNVGTLEQASGGILYLAEVDALPPHVQSTLLHTLKTGRFLRVGGSQPQKVDLRLIASSSSDIARISGGHLNLELYRKLNTSLLNTLGLREHIEDLSDLLDHFAEQYYASDGLAYRHFNVAVQNRLRNYSWPGNLHELENLIRRLLIISNDTEIRLDEVERAFKEVLPIPMPPDQTLEAAAQQHELDDHMSMSIPLELTLRDARAAFERNYLTLQLERCGGSMTKLAKKVGSERTHLYRKLHQLGLDADKKRN